MGLPRMLREIVAEALATAPGLTQVGEAAPQPNLAAAIRRHRAAFVVAGMGALSTEEVAAALDEFPRLRVLVLTQGGRTADLHELRPHRERLGEVSPERLVAVIREHAIAPVTT
jgi:DNA-binding NarL/FixJ family response regulator